MSAIASTMPRGRALVWTLTAIGLLIVAIANWRLVYLAETSQPDCVAHRQPGAASRTGVPYAAAGSACAP
jgi:hypothetical protein